MLSVIDGIAKEPPTKEEVDRARTRLLKNIDLQFNNSQSVSIVLSETAATGDWRLLFLDRDRIRKVTPEDVARVAKLYLKPSNRTIGRFIPEAKPDRSEIPATPDVVGGAEGLQGQCGGRTGRSVRSVAGEYRCANGARDAAERDEAGAAFEENARRHGERPAQFALRR